jgi:hypothetical protein
MIKHNLKNQYGQQFKYGLKNDLNTLRVFIIDKIKQIFLTHWAITVHNLSGRAKVEKRARFTSSRACACAPPTSKPEPK